MFGFPLKLKILARWILVALFPWLPAYLFERIDFYLGVSVSGYWYYQLTGWRLPADAISFALGGILIAYLLRPRLALIQIALSSVLIWVLLYVECTTFHGANGLLHSECYATGPDGLAGFRLTSMMFSFGALPAVVRAAENGPRLDGRIRIPLALFSGVVLTVVMVWYPMTAWFSGVTYLPFLVPLQAGVLIGIPQIATGILAARISRSVSVAGMAGVFSLAILSGGLWTLSCPNCDRTVLYPVGASWAIFAFLGGLTELGISRHLRLPPILNGLRKLRLEDLQRIGLALVMTVCLATVIGWNMWDARVMYATPISPSPGDMTLVQSIYPYVAGYYNSIQYRICCVQIGVSFEHVNPQTLAPNNFLMAGMGVQSPNCCIDGWDLGWRADAFLMPNSSIIVSGSTWTTCDSNANCGGYFWQYLRYHAQVTLNQQNITSPIYLRMVWEPITINGQSLYEADWYYNTTSTPWAKFGSFIPDFREGHYFDIGVCGPGCYFYQFGVGSKTPVSGWKIKLLYPSFQYQNSWTQMERAKVIEGDRSFWKANYRWGGEPYAGVTVTANAQDSTVPPGIAEFAYTGETVTDYTPLW